MFQGVSPELPLQGQGHWYGTMRGGHRAGKGPAQGPGCKPAS